MNMSTVKSKCGCEFPSNKHVADKVRLKGAANQAMPTSAEIECECGNMIVMDTLVYKCPHCKMTYAVTPCSADDHSFIVKAGIDY
jgi:hypothetical protein